MVRLHWWTADGLASAITVAGRSWLPSKRAASLALLLSLAALVALGETTASGSTYPVERRIQEDPDLSEFYSMVERDPTLMQMMKRDAMSVFAPTNRAFQSFTGNLNVLYHVLPDWVPLDRLNYRLETLANRAAVYITRRKIPTDPHYEVFVNNAQILDLRAANRSYRSEMNKRQALYIIDDVLVSVPSFGESDKLGPATGDGVVTPRVSAWDLLVHSESSFFGTFRLGPLRKQVMQQQQEHLYRGQGDHTFFLPVEQSYKPRSSLTRLDRVALEGHIIPNRVLFTACAPYNEPLRTLAFGENVKVTITFVSYGTGRDARVYVMSRTALPNARLASGTVIAQVVKANLPVGNGVVHLINRPLVVVDSNIAQALQEDEDGIFSKFFDLIEDYGPDFLRALQTGSGPRTLLVPDKTAVSRIQESKYLNDRKKMMEVFRMHLIPESLPIDRIRRSSAGIGHYATAAPNMFLYFDMQQNQQSHESIVTVEGGGVNATVLLPDITTTDGYIHLIDRVLGLPHMSVREKLETDPMLNLSYELGMLNRFNEQLNKTTRRYTFFVPRDQAWVNWFTKRASRRLDVFLQHPDKVRTVMERHLIIADRVFRMSELKSMSPESLILPTTTNSAPLRLRVRLEDRRFFIKWQEGGNWISVFRHDIECTNGIIHVLDEPLMLDTDIPDASSGSGGGGAAPWLLLVACMRCITAIWQQ
ncbi:fasciclin-1 [Anopheles aquasalis]|uniref:fasciclin-1 n=1 Tax=Anopheles aquasalis TaxID=42839 RepID=UPI00215AC13A|nr:fasciclin-1 [Anopheles aquasalis]